MSHLDQLPQSDHVPNREFMEGFVPRIDGKILDEPTAISRSLAPEDADVYQALADFLGVEISRHRIRGGATIGFDDQSLRDDLANLIAKRQFTNVTPDQQSQDLWSAAGQGRTDIVVFSSQDPEEVERLPIGVDIIQEAEEIIRASQTE
ncbi:hypothetical protein KBC31_04700 [Candidatus Saccharibacteria bacterium]|nr:hypothetical protein [Candidatus Saccharibacteria bacterium]